MSKLSALIFDVDGTLADTERDGHRVAFNRAFKEAGLDWDWSDDLYGRLLAIAGGKERMLHYMRTELPADELPPDPAGLAARLHGIKNRHYFELLHTGGIRPRPGVLRLLREAHAAGLRLAIATTTQRENVTLLLQRGFGPEAAGWFELMGTADEVPDKKPSPAVYRYVLEQLDLPPERCLAFEDSQNGIDAARAAGLDTIITVNHYTRDGDYAEAALVVDHLGEPDMPCTVLGGRAAGRVSGRDALRCVDLAALKALKGLD